MLADSDDQSFPEGVSGEIFADQRFSNESFPDKRFFDESFPDKRFSEESFPDRRFSDESFFVNFYFLSLAVREQDLLTSNIL